MKLIQTLKTIEWCSLKETLKGILIIVLFTSFFVLTFTGIDLIKELINHIGG